MKLLFPKSLLLRFFLSFLLLTTSVLIVVSVFTYLNYQRQILNESSDASKKMLFQTQFTVEFVKDWVIAHLFQLYHDGDLFNNIYGSEVSLIDEVETRRKMSQATISNPVIFSIYLYNANTQKIYSSLSVPVAADEFYDPDILRILSDPSLYRELQLIPRKVDFQIYTTRYQQNILTVVLTERLAKDQPLEGALILNLKADYLQHTMQSMYADSPDDIFIILDAEGRVLSHADPGQFLHNLSEESYAQQVLTVSEPSGVLTSEIAGKKHLVTYVSSEKLGWKFLRLTAYDKLLSKTYALRNLLIIFGTVLFLVVLIVSLWLSRRLYSPIHSLATRVSTQMGALSLVKKRMLMNELDYLSEAFSRVIHHTDELQQDAQSHRNFVRQELLKKLLRGERHTYTDLPRTFQELGLTIVPERIQVLLLRIDNYSKGFSQQLQQQNQALIKLALQDIMQKILALDYPRNEVLIMGDDVFAVMLNPDDPGQASTENTLRHLIQGIQELIGNNFALTVSGSIGGVALSAPELPAIYQEVLELSQYRLVYGWESILLLSTRTKHQTERYSYPKKIEKQLLEALRLRKGEQIERELDRLFDQVKILSYQHIITTLSKILHATIPEIHSIASDDAELRQLSARMLLEDVRRLDRLDDIRDRLLQIFQDAITHERPVIDDVKQQHVDRMLAIIKDEYMNPNLNVDEVASRLGLSTNYVRILFKESMNHSLSEYLNEIRFEKAKQLLLETDAAVREVCERIGICNVNYFYTAFKKFSGFTPTQYRQNTRQTSNE